MVHIQSRESDRKQMELNTIYSIIVPRVVSLSLLYHISTWIEDGIYFNVCNFKLSSFISESWIKMVLEWNYISNIYSTESIRFSIISHVSIQISRLNRYI